MRNETYVTQPVLPPFEEFTESLKEIWESKWLTNNGSFHQEFEKKLADFLGVKYISLFSNGTLALITALQVLRITGEVITTPYSFVATTHSLNWNGIRPAFCDIEEDHLCLNPEKLEVLITPKTTAILPVHVYGNPCNVHRIQEIADIYGLKVIYDAAHAFGVEVDGTSVANFGDLSVLSFHATKIFNTIEGGAIVCHDEKTKRRIDFLKNFGFADEVTVVGLGINAKMNELQAAYGMIQLKYINTAIEKREKLSKLYRGRFKDVPGISLLKLREDIKYNYAYFPVFINSREFGNSRDSIYSKLKEKNIYSRRYFYPLISQFPTYRGLPSASAANLPVAEKVTQEVLCLPLYPDLSNDEINKIVDIILSK